MLFPIEKILGGDGLEHPPQAERSILFSHQLVKIREKKEKLTKLRTQPVAVKSAEYKVTRVKFEPPSPAPRHREPMRHKTKLWVWIGAHFWAREAMQAVRLWDGRPTQSDTLLHATYVHARTQQQQFDRKGTKTGIADGLVTRRYHAPPPLTVPIALLVMSSASRGSERIHLAGALELVVLERKKGCWVPREKYIVSSNGPEPRTRHHSRLGREFHVSVRRIPLKRQYLR